MAQPRLTFLSVIHTALWGCSPYGLGRDLLAWLGLEEGGRASCWLGKGQAPCSWVPQIIHSLLELEMSSQIIWPRTPHFTEVHPEQLTGPGHGDITVWWPSWGFQPRGLPCQCLLGHVQPVHLRATGQMGGPGAEMAIIMTDSPTPKMACSYLFLRTGSHSLGGVRRGLLERGGQGGVGRRSLLPQGRRASLCFFLFKNL